jgi:hypothetical protein
VPLHLDIPTQQQLTALLAARATPSVSLYLPTGHLPQDAAAARIELKNLAHEALTQVEDAGLPAAEVREHLDDLHDDEGFWATQAISLAVFATPGGVRTFRLPNRLTTLVEVSDRYHPQAAAAQRHVPAGRVRARARAGLGPAHRGGRRSPGRGGPGRGSPRRRRQRRGQGVDHGPLSRRAHPGLRGPEGQDAPVRAAGRRGAAPGARCGGRSAHPGRRRAAGVDLPLGEQLSDPRAADHPGQPGDRHARRAGRRGARCARCALAEELGELRRLFEQRWSQGRAAAEITDIARAATFGAVQTLMADMDDVVSGFVDEESGAVTIDADGDATNYGVLDEVARRVLGHGGRVLALRREDIPGGGTAAAILRYPV